MRVTHKSADGRLSIEVDGNDTKDCFTQLASAVEVFSVSVCGACDSTNTMPVTRENKGNHFYEVKCQSCGFSLSFGQRKIDGALYPRRRDADGNAIANNGWTKWNPKAASEEQDDPFVQQFRK